MAVAQEAGMAMPEILEMLAASAPYEILEINNHAYAAFGSTEAPTWILGDRIVSGIADADEIMRIQKTMTASPSPVEEAEAEEEVTETSEPAEAPAAEKPRQQSSAPKEIDASHEGVAETPKASTAVPQPASASTTQEKPLALRPGIKQDGK
jgi:hypothetical protein